jgi:hypothetical protein
MSERTDIPLMLLRVLCMIRISHEVYELAYLSLFDMDTLSFELCLHKHHASLTPSCLENQNASEFFVRPFFGKNDGSSPMKSVAFCWALYFFEKGKKNATSNST